MTGPEASVPEEFRRRSCPACFGGYVTLGGEDDEGHPVEEAVPCRRCHGATR